MGICIIILNYQHSYELLWSFSGSACWWTCRFPLVQLLFYDLYTAAANNWFSIKGPKYISRFVALVFFSVPDAKGVMILRHNRNSSFWSYHVEYVCIKFQPCLTLTYNILLLFLWFRSTLLTIVTKTGTYLPAFLLSSCIPWRTLNERADRLRTPAPTLIKSKVYKPCEGGQLGSACWELVTWYNAQELEIIGVPSDIENECWPFPLGTWLLYHSIIISDHSNMMNCLFTLFEGLPDEHIYKILI
jgi:hypothetical protein